MSDKPKYTSLIPYERPMDLPNGGLVQVDAYRTVQGIASVSLNIDTGRVYSDSITIRLSLSPEIAAEIANKMLRGAKAAGWVETPEDAADG